MKRLRAGIHLTGVTALVLGAGLAGASQAGVNVPSEVTMRQSDNNPAKFKGRVTSPASDCVVGRKVKVYRVTAGNDQKVNKTFASESGKWSLIIPMQQNGTKLYAVIETFETPLGTRCANDRSPKVTVSN
jgi:hypothetical protein